MLNNQLPTLGGYIKQERTRLGWSKSELCRRGGIANERRAISFWSGELTRLEDKIKAPRSDNRMVAVCLKAFRDHPQIVKNIEEWR